MGRSVSTPRNAAVTAYAHVSSSYYCRTCADCREDETDAEPGEQCPRCEALNRIADIQFDDDTTRANWDDDMANLSSTLCDAFPSLRECDRWLGDEDHVILENRHAAVSVSEYCGLVAVCLVPEARSEYESSPMIARRWCAQVEARFRRIVADVFGTELVKLGTMSNGEGVFRKAEARV